MTTIITPSNPTTYHHLQHDPNIAKMEPSQTINNITTPLPIPLRKATYIKIKDLANYYSIDISTLPKLYKETLKQRQETLASVPQHQSDKKNKKDDSNAAGTGSTVIKVDPCEIGANARPRGSNNIQAQNKTNVNVGESQQQQQQYHHGSGGSGNSISGNSTNSPKSVHTQKSLSCGYNLCVLVGDINMVVDKFRVDQSRVRLAEVEVGDETGTISLRARDDQIDILQTIVASKNKKNSAQNSGAVVLRNCTIELYQNKHLRLAITKWGKLSYYPDNIDSTPNPPLSMNREKNISLADVSNVILSSYNSNSDSNARSAGNTTDAFQQGIGRNNDTIFHNNDSLNASSSAGGAKHHYNLGVGGGRNYTNKHNMPYSTSNYTNYPSYHQDYMQQQQQTGGLSAFHYPAQVHHNHPNSMIHQHAQQQSKQTNRSSRYNNQHQNNYYRNNHNNNSNRRDHQHHNCYNNNNNQQQQRFLWQQYHNRQQQQQIQQQQLNFLYYQQEQMMARQQQHHHQQHQNTRQQQQLFPANIIMPGLVRSVSIDSSCSADMPPPPLFIPLEQQPSSPTNIYTVPSSSSSYTPTSPSQIQQQQSTSSYPYVIQENVCYSPSHESSGGDGTASKTTTQWQHDQHYFNIDSTPSTPNIQQNATASNNSNTNNAQQQISFTSTHHQQTSSPQTQPISYAPYYTFSPISNLNSQGQCYTPATTTTNTNATQQQQFYIPQQQHVQQQNDNTADNNKQSSSTTLKNDNNDDTTKTTNQQTE